MRVHPKLAAQVRSHVESALAGVMPPDEDPVELAESAAAIDVDVETLREWRKDYQWWTTPDEWRRGIIDATVGQIMRDIATPGPRNWRRWKITRKACAWAYALGLSAGGSTQYDWSGSYVTGIHISGTRNRHTGKRYRPVYVLAWQVGNWRCLLRQHHWPSPHKVMFGICAKCAPCPDCGQAAPLDHDCTVAVAGINRPHPEADQ